jgi:glycosyl transferase family 87
MLDAVRRWQQDARARFAAACVYALVAVPVVVGLLRDAIAGKLAWALRQGSGDCVVNWLAARAFERDIDPYSPAGLAWAGLASLGHPPTTSLWYLPFTRYGVFELTAVWGTLLILLLLIHFVLLVQELRAPVPIVTALVGYALVMDTSWWQDHVAMVQVSEPIAFAYLLAWIFLRRRHDVAAGIAIGVAMTIKPYAALLVLLLLVGRRWSGAIAATATYLVAAAVVTWRFGARCWLEYVAGLPAAQAGWTAHIRNASLSGIVARLWRPACEHGGAPPRTATIVAMLASAGLVALLAWSARDAVRRQPEGAGVDDEVDLPFAAFTVASAWLNPVTWEHYDVTLIMPIGIALFAAFRLPPRRAAAAWAAATALLLVAVALLLGIAMQSKLRVAAEWPAHRHLMLHLYEVANWLPWPLVLGACMALAWKRRRS